MTILLNSNGESAYEKLNINADWLISFKSINVQNIEDSSLSKIEVCLTLNYIA